MAHFYGTIQGSRGQASRLGGKGSGLQTVAAGWGGAINTRIWHDEATGKDMYRIELTPWKGSGGQCRLIEEGELQT